MSYSDHKKDSSPMTPKELFLLEGRAKSWSPEVQAISYLCCGGWRLEELGSKISVLPFSDLSHLPLIRHLANND
jgi:hypothetical protein